MADAYISEIQIYGFNFAPKFWAQCNGQTMAIAQNQALFSLLGTTYGGNGVTTFQLPNLQGRSAIHFGQRPGGSNFSLGQVGGEVNHTLTVNEMPSHNHTMQASNNTADLSNADGNLLAKAGTDSLFNTAQNGATLAANAIANGGGGQPHVNMQPYLVLNYCICLSGVFPSRN